MKLSSSGRGWLDGLRTGSCLLFEMSRDGGSTELPNVRRGACLRAKPVSVEQHSCAARCKCRRDDASLSHADGSRRKLLNLMRRGPAAESEGVGVAAGLATIQ
jgi:hypothetical protein